VIKNLITNYGMPGSIGPFFMNAIFKRSQFRLRCPHSKVQTLP